MYKLIQNDMNFFQGEPLVSAIDLHQDFMSKHASADSAVADYVKTLAPREDGIYIHINALGGPNWGCNSNGDYFEKEVLSHECPLETCERKDDYGYKTFMKYAYPYKHHVNKDPNASIGEKVAFSTYNDKMDRVELVAFIKRAADKGLCQKIENGEAVPVSMGTKVLYDVCSVCGNLAKKRDEYCDHLKYNMKQMMPDGRQVYAINKYPRFFDISFVLIPAEKASYVMKKVAGVSHTVPSVFIADALGIEAPKVALEDKKAEIKKEIPISEVSTEQPSQDVVKAFMSLLPKINSLEPSVSDDSLKGMSAFPLRDILSTVTSLGMVLKPREFQKIVVIKSGKSEGVEPELSSDGVNEDILKYLKPTLVDRCCHRPALRVRLLKLASQSPVEIDDQTLQQDLVSKGLPTIAAISSLYDLYRSKLARAPGGLLLEAVERKPLLAAILGAVAAATIGSTQLSLEKTAKLGRRAKGAAILGSLAYPYFVGSYKKHKYLTEGKVPGDIGIQFIKHPGAIGLASLIPTLKVLKKVASVQDAVRVNRAVTWPLVEDAPGGLVDAAIVNGFFNI